MAADLVQLDWLFRFSLLRDLALGLETLHHSALACHGRLSSCCCFVDGHFIAKISDYGLPTLFSQHLTQEESSVDAAALLLWTAPELLRIRSSAGGNLGSQEGDIYSLSCIMHQIIVGHARPFANLTDMEPKS